MSLREKSETSWRDRERKKNVRRPGKRVRNKKVRWHGEIKTRWQGERERNVKWHGEREKK